MSFPASERVDFATLLESIETGRHTLVILEESENVLGFATLTQLTCQQVYFLGYMAIDQRFRCLGLGSQLLQQVLHFARHVGEAPGILFEVDDPQYGSAQETLTRKRRIEFYHRNGALRLDVPQGYHVPDFSTAGTLEMYLMWLPLRQESEQLTPAEIQRYLLCIYKEVYHLDDDHPLVRSVLI